jgi:hypothetical protein
MPALFSQSAHPRGAGMSATLHFATDLGTACGRTQEPRVAATAGPQDITDTTFDVAICPQCLDVVDMLEENNRQRFLIRQPYLARIHREREESAPSTSRRAQLPGGSSLSRREPMPVLFVGGLAFLAVFAIFGVISIGQFLQSILGR